MTRIQILELPSEQVGEVYRTPFVLVFDQLDGDAVGATADFVKEATGARGVLAFDNRVDVA